jgi:hypothetical protein
VQLGNITMAELITVQLGNYANFVGSHYWNIQVNVRCDLEYTGGVIARRADPILLRFLPG